MDGKNKSLRRCWVEVGLIAFLAITLLVTLVGCERPKRSKSSGLPTVEPAATSATSQATVSASPTTITVDKTKTPGVEPPPPTATPSPTTPPTPTATSVPVGGVTYIVKPGDSLYSIARRYNMTVDEIMELNGITDPTSLQVGQELIISSGQAVATPTTPGQETVHVVQRGENLFRIALKYGVTVEAVAKRNGIVNPSLIWTGQKLYIPAGGSPSPGNIHVVQRGQNLYRISLIHGTTVQAIMQANKLSSTVIYVGQRLRIP
jgi:LysM repeat protein